MFDFERWRHWLKDAAEQLRAEGFSANWNFNDRYSRGTWVEVAGNGLLASFRNFESGFVDYDVLDARTSQFVADEAMISVTDENFAAVFGIFRKIFGEAISDEKIVEDLRAIEVKIPAILTKGPGEVTDGLLDIAVRNLDTLALRLTDRTDQDDIAKFFYWKIFPMLQAYGLAENEHTSEADHRRFFLNKKGEAFFAKLVAKNSTETISKRASPRAADSVPELAKSKRRLKPKA